MNNENMDKENKNERARSEFPSEGLEGMFDYGRRLIDAQYSVSTKISLLQEDIYDLAERSGFSIESIVRRAFGDVRGMDAFAGRSRTILASEGRLWGNRTGALEMDRSGEPDRRSKCLLKQDSEPQNHSKQLLGHACANRRSKKLFREAVLC